MTNSYRRDDRIKSVTAIVSGSKSTGNHNLGVTIPDNAIITRVIEDCDNLTGTTDNSGTIELTLGSGGTSITASNAMPTAGVTETVISSTNMGTKLDGASTLHVTISTRAMASGKVRYHVEYIDGLI